MPKCGSQVYLCDLPIRFDNYNGCSHGCSYCFAQSFKDITKIKKDEGVTALRRFIEGRRNLETSWCDWDIPIHWGGLSDPFQPVERKHKTTLACLELFRETQYPFVVSTKGKLLADDKYLSLLKECNCVVQISAVCSSYDKIELGCPTFEERVEIMRKISPHVKRVIARMQPYLHEVFDEAYESLAKFKEAGAYGVIVEGMKFKKKKEGLVKIGGDWCYEYDIILTDFLKLKERAHELGLKIYAGENRIRSYGDSLSCCGIDGLEGFKGNTYNLNHMLHGDFTEPTEAMKKEGSATVFDSLRQKTIHKEITSKVPFDKYMINYYREKKDKIDEIFGITQQKR